MRIHEIIIHKKTYIMPFNGTEGGAIPLEDAANLTSKYRSKNPNARRAHFFGKDILNQLLEIDGAMGIRMYHGIDEEGKKELVLVAADADENDILELVVDLNRPCPSFCGQNNVLNS